MSENTIPFIFHDENGKVVDPAASDIQVYALSLSDKSIPIGRGESFTVDQANAFVRKIHADADYYLNDVEDRYEIVHAYLMTRWVDSFNLYSLTNLTQVAYNHYKGQHPSVRDFIRSLFEAENSLWIFEAVDWEAHMDSFDQAYDHYDGRFFSKK